MTDYPATICVECGERYGKSPHSRSCVTYYPGTCDICGAPDGLVTEPRDFGHLRPDWIRHKPKKKSTEKPDP